MGFQINQDFSNVEPDSGGGSYFPVSDAKGWLVMMTASEGKENSGKTGMVLNTKLKGLEGVVLNKEHDWSINLSNPSQQAVDIGQGQLSAVAHVTGHIRVGNSAEWHGKPFRVVVAQEIDKETKQPTHRTRIAAILDQNSNKPKEAGQGALAGATAAGGAAAASWSGAGAAATTEKAAFTPNAAAVAAASQANPSAPRFDPVTGQPIQAAAATGGFDPVTGQPLAAAAPQPRFDPVTGQPITATVAPAVRYDPNTGQPITGGDFQQTGSTDGPGWAA